MNYQRINPSPPPNAYEFPALRALASVWQERKTALEGDGAYKDFIRRLQREWAIETGIIERLYTWDRGVTEVFIEQGIESSIIAHRGGVSKQDLISELPQLEMVRPSFRLGSRNPEPWTVSLMAHPGDWIPASMPV